MNHLFCNILKLFNLVLLEYMIYMESNIKIILSNKSICVSILLLNKYKKKNI